MRIVSLNGLIREDSILITNLMHWLLFIHKIFSSTCFDPQALIFRRIQLYTCSIWYWHSLREFVVACRYTAWVRTDCRGKVVGGCLKTVFLNRRALASIVPGRERPEETTICYKISLVQWLITNLNVILYLSTCHTVYISILILFMIMP